MNREKSLEIEERFTPLLAASVSIYLKSIV